MTANEHMDAVKQMIPSMSRDELSILILRISEVTSLANWYHQNKTHSSTHHSTPAENDK